MTINFLLSESRERIYLSWFRKLSVMLPRDRIYLHQNLSNKDAMIFVRYVNTLFLDQIDVPSVVVS
jgi:hypothetical protein